MIQNDVFGGNNQALSSKDFSVRLESGGRIFRNPRVLPRLLPFLREFYFHIKVCLGKVTPKIVTL